MKFAYASGSRPLDGYTIKRGIGKGGFGEVYFATSDAGKEVALKRIDQRKLEVERRGVMQCLNLKHANLIALWDIKNDDQGEAWVVMEYVSGESLKDVIDRNPNGLPIDEVHAWFNGVAAGVAYLHDHGIVHRDLKPGNIFLDEDVVKIGDYGLSKFISCSRRSGQTESVGTLHYMAPEIGKGVYGKEIDIYALGIILFEMLTGRVPFDGESSQEIMMKHLTADPDLSGIAPQYRGVIRKALAKDPDRRYGSVREMLQDGPFNGPRLGIGALDDLASTVAGPAQPSLASPDVESRTEPLIIGDQDQDICLGELKELYVAEAVPDPRKPARIVRHWLIGWWPNWRFRKASPAPARHHIAPRTEIPYRHRSTKLLVGDYLAARPQSERLTELTGSLLLSAIVCAVLCLLMLAIGGEDFGSSIQWWSFYAWLTVTSTVGAWMVLAISKFWEGTIGDHMRRRFAMLVIGLLLGGLAYYNAHELLIVHWPTRRVEHFGDLYTGSGAPRLPAYLTYLASLFVVIRWWKQADPGRRVRLSSFDLLTTGFCAWILGILWQFPIWGVAVAVAISVAVQLSAAWINPRQRSELRKQYQPF